MNRTPLSLPEIGIIAATRAALGAGIGLLLSDRLSNEQRRAVGWTLFGVGALSTVPILVAVLKSQRDVTGRTSDGSARRPALQECRA
jgi:hypothetical protein